MIHQMATLYPAQIMKVKLTDMPERKKTLVKVYQNKKLELSLSHRGHATLPELLGHRVVVRKQQELDRGSKNSFSEFID